MDTELLGEGICMKCKSQVVFAYSRPLESNLETKRCLSCGLVYYKDNTWKKVKEGEKE